MSYEYYGGYSFFSGLGISFFSFVNDYGVFSWCIRFKRYKRNFTSELLFFKIFKAVSKKLIEKACEVENFVKRNIEIKIYFGEEKDKRI